jgi:hypothetical protein
MCACKNEDKDIRGYKNIQRDNTKWKDRRAKQEKVGQDEVWGKKEKKRGNYAIERERKM